MTTFNIIESDWTKDFYSTYKHIKQDIKNGVKIKDIKKKYGLSDGGWRAYRKELILDGIIKSRETERKEAKYYTAYNNKFHVQKIIHRKKYHIGTFNTEHQAKLCVKLMQECNWDISQIEQVKSKVREE